MLITAIIVSGCFNQRLSPQFTLQHAPHTEYLLKDVVQRRPALPDVFEADTSTSCMVQLDSTGYTTNTALTTCAPVVYITDVNTHQHGREGCLHNITWSPAVLWPGSRPRQPLQHNCKGITLAQSGSPSLTCLSHLHCHAPAPMSQLISPCSK